MSTLYHLLRDSDFLEVIFGLGNYPSCLGQILSFLGQDRNLKIKCILDLSPEHWEDLKRILRLNPYFDKVIHDSKILRKSEKIGEMEREDFIKHLKKFYGEAYPERMEIMELQYINYVTGFNSEVIRDIHTESRKNSIILARLYSIPMEYRKTYDKGFKYKNFSLTELSDKVKVISDAEEIGYDANANLNTNWEADPFGTNESKYSNFTYFTSQGQVPEWLDRFMKSKTNRNNEKAFDKIVTINNEFEELIEYSKFIAGHDENVLILGETGVGKELFAKGIHENSSRRSASFVAINCAAIPDSLFESEMFGSTKGAYTNSYEDREGYFQQANKGTLFLDEIGDLSMQNQAKVLRAIQEKYVTRVGGEGKREKVDVRLISATNKDLSGSSNSDFRSDLLFRIGVMQINIPPLRDRGKQEIIFLAHYFREQLCNRYDAYDHITFSKEAEQILGNYHWPGNVRQLESLVYNIVVYAGFEIKNKRKEFLEQYLNQPETPHFVSYSINGSEVLTFLNQRQVVNANHFDQSRINSLDQESNYKEKDEEIVLSAVSCCESLVKEILEEPENIKNKLEEYNFYIGKRVHEELMKEHKTESRVGEILGLSQQTVSSRLKKFGLSKK